MKKTVPHPKNDFVESVSCLAQGAASCIQRQADQWLERCRYWEWQPPKNLLEKQAEYTLGQVHQPRIQRQLLKNRQTAAALLEQVLDEAISPLQALVRWPIESEEESDPSLQAAYQILWHFESDETSQQQEPFYLDTQLALLSQVSALLAKGQPLPGYMLGAYTTEHTARFYFGQSYTRVFTRVFTMPVRVLLGWISRVCQAG